MIELVVAGSVLMIGALAVVQMFGISVDVGRSNRETALAAEAARGALEQLESFEQHSSLFALHNTRDDDDPVGVLPLPGFTGFGFVVAGLSPLADDPDGLVGEIVFPVDADSGLLREDVDLPELGMPRDLDGDQVIDGNDHSDDYVLLPILVRLRWDSGGTPRTHEVRTILSPR